MASIPQRLGVTKVKPLAVALLGGLLFSVQAVAGQAGTAAEPTGGPARSLAVAATQLTRPGLKCLSAPAYYPGAGMEYTRYVANDVAYLNPAMLRVEFIGENDTSHTINYPAYDYLADKTGSQGIEILGLIDYQSVAWSDQSEWATQAFRDRFVQRVTEIVQHYSTRTNPIRNWEIWNEEDIQVSGFNVRIEPEPYAQLLVQTYDAVKSVDAGSTVVLGGISPKGLYYSENYLDELYNTAAFQNYYTSHGAYPFDVVAVHPYPDFSGFTVDTLKSELDTVVKGVMDAHGDSNKTVWLTEMGWNSCNLTPISGLTRRQSQAKYLTDSYLKIDQEVPYVTRYFWFRYNDFGTSDCWGLVENTFTNQKPAYAAYLALTDPGPVPPVIILDPGEDPPVWGGMSDADLPVQVSNNDLIEGMMPVSVQGGFHPASTGGVERLTNGVFDPELTSVVLRDYAIGEPSLSVEYQFPHPVRIDEIRIFAGHTADGGNRAFQSDDIYINGTLAAYDLTTGNYGQVSPSSTATAVSVVRLLPKNGEDAVAHNATSVRIDMWCTSSLNLDFRDRWSPYNDPQEDIDGADPAYVAPIIKEIDVLGQVETSSSVDGFILY